MISLLAFLGFSLVLVYKVLPFVLGLFGLDFEALKTVFSDGGYVISIELSFIWALFNSSILTVVATVLAWHFRRKRNLLFYLLFFPWAVPMYLSTMMWRYAIYGVGGRSLVSLLGLPNDILRDPLTAFLWTSFVNVWVNLPIVAFSISASLEEVPEDLYESAEIDGASKDAIFFNIALPLLKPSITGWFLINFVRFFHSFTIPYLMTEGGPITEWGYTRWGVVGATTTLGVYNFSVFSRTLDFRTMTAYATVTFLFMAILVSLWVSWEKRGFFLVAGLGEIFWFSLKGSPISVVLAILAIATWSFERREKTLEKFLLLLSIPSMVFTVDVFAVIFLVRKLLGFRRKRILLRTSGFVRALGWGIGFVVLISVVLLAMALTSTLTGEEPVPVLRKFDFGAFERLFDEGYAVYLLNSLEIAVPVAVLAPIVSFPLAYVVSRRGLNWLLTFFAIVQSLGGIHLLVLIYTAYVRLHLVDRTVALIPLILANVVPQVLIMTKGMIDSIGREYEDFALLEGGRRVAMRVVLRMSAPMLFMGSLVGFMGGWNAFLAPLMLIVSEWKYPVSVKLYDFIGEPMSGYPRWDLFGAGTLVNVAITASLFYITRRMVFKRGR